MRTLSAVSLVCVLFCCGEKKSEDETGQAAAKDPVVVKLEAAKDEMCACKDAACVDTVQKKYTEWGSSKDSDQEVAKLVEDAEAMKKFEAAINRYGDCMKKNRK